MRTFTVGLSLFLAAFLSASSPQSPTPIAAHIRGIETLTPQEMDCIVGGEAGCGEVAGAIYDGCMDNAGVSPTDYEAYGAAATGCAVRSAWGFVICGVGWLFGLLF